ncbi:high-affinity choline transporter 1-like isoform X2 [Amblyomma americanum]
MGPAFLLMFTTFTGGLTAMIHADAVQLTVMFLGMWFCVPFVYFNQPVVKATYSTGVWLGSFTPTELSISYLDNLLALVLGGVPWQVYFQRVLACRMPQEAEQASYITALGCILAAIPAIIIGAVAKAAEYARGNETGALLFQNKSISMLLPLTLRYMSPPAVSAVGLTAVSAAAMSTVGSSTLSVASMFAWNVYKAIFRNTASDYEVDFVMRLSVVVVGISAVYLASSDATALRALWSLSADLVYVVLFPHLLSVFYLRDHCNTYGALTGYIVGVALRANSFDSSWTSDPLSDNRQVLPLEKAEGQRYPVRTMAMMTCFATIIGTSLFSKWLFAHVRIPPKYDIFDCFSASRCATVRHRPSGYFGRVSPGASFLPSWVPRLLRQSERKARGSPEVRPLFDAGCDHAFDCVEPEIRSK